ncbi:MarR family transcriptional regulator [Psychromonas sp. RZ22]|uniref:MarR family winged helix-turn-helix transcriptional regulator n=1 Tax=Psychromonas algarum TaxID=2555643 RepID=UPI0010688F19|nr:MarR family transcriptional regulator [Psychromonas sp. RZ22]TEW56015.1 MarR family transcriptional regulator [Psychromonas sp. RZ22]
MKNSLREIELAMRENWPECAETMSFALLKVTRVQELFKNEIESCVGQYDLQHADFSVLATLRRSPVPYCLSPTDLYKSMFFSSGGLTKVLVRLVDAGLIKRVENPDDKRSKLVQLNTKGKQLVEKIMTQLHQQDKSLLSGLTAVETMQLDTLLQKVLDHNEEG